MAKNNLIVGLDIGTSKVRTVIASMKGKEELRPKIIGVGESNSSGMRRGVIVDIEEMTRSIKKSIEQAERTSGVSIDRAYISIGGSHIKASISKGVVAVSRADEEVSVDDMLRAINSASAISLDPNREIIHVIPREFRIDNQEGIQDPRGMTGVRLEVDTLIIEGLTPHIKNLKKCVNAAGIEIEDLVLNIIAASKAVLSKKEKELGVLILDLGGGTVGMSVYEEGKLLHIHILPVGSSHITSDIAIGLRTSIETAEKVKLQYGTCLSSEIGKKEDIDLSKLDEKEEGIVSRKEIAKIIEARIEEIFNLANKELKRIDRERLLPSGIVLIGGGSAIPGIDELAKEKLKLPVKFGNPQGADGLTEKVNNPSFSTVIGLIFWALEMSEGQKEGNIFLPTKSSSSINTINKIKSWVKKNFFP